MSAHTHTLKIATQHVDAVLWALARLRVADDATVAALAARYRALLPDAAPATAGSSLLALVCLGCTAERPGPLGGAFVSEYAACLGRGVRLAAAEASGAAAAVGDPPGGGGGSGEAAAAEAARDSTAAADEEEGEEERGHGLALALYALARWCGRGLLPRRNLLRGWLRATAPLLHRWAPRDLAAGAAALGHFRAAGAAADAWAAAAMAASLQPRQLAALRARDAAALLEGLAAMRQAAQAAAARRDGAAAGSSASSSASASYDEPYTAADAGDAWPSSSAATASAAAAASAASAAAATWWPAHQAATLVLLPDLTLAEATRALSAAARLRWRASPDWVARVGQRGLELAREAAAAAAAGDAPRGQASACLLLSALGRAVSDALAPDDAAKARRALAPGVAAVAVALAPGLEARATTALDLVQLVGALARLGVRPGPSFAAAHARGVERVSATVTPTMWRALRDAYAALRLAPSGAMLRAFVVHDLN